MPNMLKDKNILLGVCGSIASYKAAELTRLFVKAGANVKVILTADASNFITPLTLATLSKNPVYTQYFDEETQQIVKIPLHRALRRPVQQRLGGKRNMWAERETLGVIQPWGGVLKAPQPPHLPQEADLGIVDGGAQ